MTAVLWFQFALGAIAGFCVSAAVAALYWARQFRAFTRAVTRMR